MRKTIYAVTLAALLLAGCKSAEPSLQVTAVPTESIPAAGGKVIQPLPSTIDPANIDDAIVHIGFQGTENVKEDTGRTVVTLSIYAQELYDLVDISMMQAGDTIVIAGQKITITTLEEQNGDKVINGGYENGGYTLRTSEAGVYYTISFSDALNYYELGSVTLPLAEQFQFIDESDPSQGSRTLTQSQWLQESNRNFAPENTVARIADGAIQSITVFYMP